MRWSIGRLGKPRGLGGEIRYVLFIADPDVLSPKRVFVAGVEHRLERHQLEDLRHGVVKLTGFDRAKAEASVGAELEVDSSWFREALPLVSLRGAQVLDADSGAPLGRVREVEDNGAQRLLAIEAEAGEVLVPLVPAFVTGVEGPAEARIVRLRPIDGLLSDAPEP